MSWIIAAAIVVAGFVVADALKAIAKNLERLYGESDRTNFSEERGHTEQPGSGIAGICSGIRETRFALERIESSIDAFAPKEEK